MSAVLVSTNVVVYMDSLRPGSEPPKNVVKQIEQSFQVTDKYSIRSVKCQKQHGPDCLVFSVANLDLVLSGNDVSKIKFDETLLRSFLVESLIAGRIYFPFKRCNTRGEATVFSRKYKIYNK